MIFPKTFYVNFLECRKKGKKGVEWATHANTLKKTVNLKKKRHLRRAYQSFCASWQLNYKCYMLETLGFYTFCPKILLMLILQNANITALLRALWPCFALGQTNTQSPKFGRLYSFWLVVPVDHFRLKGVYQSGLLGKLDILPGFWEKVVCKCKCFHFADLERTNRPCFY